MNLREISFVVPAHAAVEGDGMPIQRAIPARNLPLLDPFLLLDHFGPVSLPPGTDGGIPDHPHRGFQTLTYLLQGAMEHKDSRGGHGRLEPGGAQWMNAASGIVHSEMPMPEVREAGGAIEGLQLWINLPAELKGMTPGYQDVQVTDIPTVALPGGALRVLAGTWAGVTGPVPQLRPFGYAFLELGPGGTFEHQLPEGWNAALYLRSGEGVAGPTDRPVKARDLVVLKAQGGGLRLATEGGATALLLTGQPLGEPIARYGPFVMNTEAEIHQAFEDYRAGRMGFIPA
jgi:redox-sensitive bicupin YhaK (pirin superfamily)